MERSLVVVLLVGACVLGGAGVARADFVIPKPKPPGPNAKIAIDALNEAAKVVNQRDHACTPRLRQPATSQSHEPPPPDVLAAFAVLRRPATPQDAPGSQLTLSRVPGTLAVDYVRRARVLPNGMSVWVIPSLGFGYRVQKRPERCFALERVALDHRLRGKPAQAQRFARRLLRSAQRSERARAKEAPRPGLFVFVTRKRGGFGGGGGEVAQIRKHGMFSATVVHGHQTLMVGLVPDGVARIDFTFARGHGIEQTSRRRFYRHIYRRSVAVVHNVVALTVPRAPEDAFWSRQVWRAADGSVVNVVKPPRAG
jgi:hypothetical protein